MHITTGTMLTVINTRTWAPLFPAEVAIPTAAVSIEFTYPAANPSLFCRRKYFFYFFIWRLKPTNQKITRNVVQRKTDVHPPTHSHPYLSALSAFPPICFIVQIFSLLIYSFKFYLCKHEYLKSSVSPSVLHVIIIYDKSLSTFHSLVMEEQFIRIK